ncbi:hypothetical protein PE067_15315 [Paracoccus sp. DMF-8]|uniref:hypothetical protein n=1 Tax=Paracoccus sp. DMF-8 TaxID=3019445 RepID=UPI0023E3B04E|nr:hypothetical protein [Paracoccus sp. DMF-8]MDF3607384.1 hypothetical protein [Paracoccus sp. DMF-8]
MVNRLVALVIALLFWGGVVLAGDGPAELPPPGFASQQYIDSKGCVFRRDDMGRWAPRMNSDDTPVCGYPPTLSARRPSPDDATGLFSAARPEPARAHQIEAALAGLVIPNLQAGELVGDRTAFQPRPDMGPEPSLTAPLRELRAEIEGQGQVRAQMNGMLQPNRALCQLLGLDTQKPGGTGMMPGADPTQGFCDSIPRNDLARLAFARPANLPVPAGTEAVAAASETLAARVPVRAGSVARAAKSGAAASKAPASTDADVSTTIRSQLRSPAAAPKPGTAVPRSAGAGGQAARTPPTGPWITGIPAGTRFILIGTYQNGPEVDGILRRLSGLNMPIMRQISPAPVQGSTQVILVGPFDSRQSIVRAFDRLRRAGLPASPR